MLEISAPQNGGAEPPAARETTVDEAVARLGALRRVWGRGFRCSVLGEGELEPLRLVRVLHPARGA